MNEQEIIEKVESVSDAATEAIVPEIIETVEVVKNNPYILIGTALVAVTSGIAIGYKVAEKRMTTQFEELLQEELKKTKQHYENRIDSLEGAVHYEESEVPEEWVHPEVPDAEEQRLLNKYAGVKVKDDTGTVTVEETTVEVDEEGDEVVKVTEKRNIFVDGRPIEEFDYSEEMKNRSSESPYVISEEEFLANDEGFSQYQMTYYEGDDVLTDEHERTIDAVDELLGIENLSRFGHGSKDKNLVYIRNEQKLAEYEVARSRGKYSVEVLGFEEEDDRKPRKFRDDD